jgi:hypothetical protein
MPAKGRSALCHVRCALFAGHDAAPDFVSNLLLLHDASLSKPAMIGMSFPPLKMFGVYNSRSNRSCRFKLLGGTYVCSNE